MGLDHAVVENAGDGVQATERAEFGLTAVEKTARSVWLEERHVAERVALLIVKTGRLQIDGEKMPVFATKGDGTRAVEVF